MSGLDIDSIGSDRVHARRIGSAFRIDRSDTHSRQVFRDYDDLLSVVELASSVIADRNRK